MTKGPKGKCVLHFMPSGKKSLQVHHNRLIDNANLKYSKAKEIYAENYEIKLLKLNAEKNLRSRYRNIYGNFYSHC